MVVSGVCPLTGTAKAVMRAEDALFASVGVAGVSEGGGRIISGCRPDCAAVSMAYNQDEEIGYE
jgi:hypothetical protein